MAIIRRACFAGVALAALSAAHALAQTAPGGADAGPLTTARPDAGVQSPAAQGPTTAAGIQAQTAPPGTPSVSEVVVTGSRIARSDLTGPQPVDVVSGQYIRDRGFTNLADAVNQLPAAGVAITPQGDQNDFGTGRNYINLFDLGTNRTLTLVNGRRFVGDNPSNIFANEAGNQVDINAFPTLFVDRIEDVPATGAAVYGSDAVAGVVNIILKKKYEGFETDFQTGLSDTGDAPRYTVETAFGHTFLDGKLNLAVDFQYDRTNALTYADRPRTAAQYAFVPNPADTGPNDGIPGTILIGDDRFANVSAGGLPFTLNGRSIFLPGTTLPVQFGQDGDLVRYHRGKTYDFYDSSGGDALNLAPDIALQSPVDRKVVTSIASYDFNPHLRLEATFFYSNNGSTEPVNQPNYSAIAFGTSDAFNQPIQGAALKISPDNAFLTPEAKAVLQANNVRAFYLSRADTDLTPSPVMSEDYTVDGALNLEGDFHALNRDFTWNAAWTRGSSNSTFDEDGFVYGNPQYGVANRFGYALDSVLDAAGQPICRVKLNHPNSTNPDIANCAPLDVFGVNNASAAAKAYITDDFGYASHNQQDDGQLNVSTSVLKLPAGDLKISAGYEYRREEASFDPDLAAREGIGYSVPIAGQAGAYDTNEGYVETLIPILGPGFNLPFAYKFEMEGAYRKIDNSLAGTNEAWSFGGRFSPTQDLTIRGSRSKTFRAPAITELFAASTPAYDAGTDPCQKSNITSGPNPSVRQANCAAAFAALGANLNNFTSSTVQNVTIPVNIGGNPNLTNEIGQSWTYGLVVTPRWIPGLSITADYVHIDINNAIEFFGIGDLLESCYDTPGYPSASCSKFTRDNTGQVTTANETYINAGYTHFAGAQYNLSYDRAVNRLPFVDTARDLGRLGISFNALNTRRLITSPSGLGFDATNLAGVIGAPAGTTGVPRWKWQANVRYAYGPVSATWTTHYLSGSAYDLTFTIENQSILTVGDYYSHDLSLQYDIDKRFSVRLNVYNITDAQPPFPVGGAGIGSYDVIGRYFLLGVSGKF